MVGGLIQLATYGTQDIFLTGSPQITFFKIIYRRHTNFAIEPIRQYFIGDTNFDQEMMVIVDKIGDLMSKVYLEIDLPKVDLLKNSSHWKNDRDNIKCQFEQIKKYYQMICNYITINVDIVRKINILLKTNNISILDIQQIIENQDFINNLISARKQLYSYISNNDFDNIVELKDIKSGMIKEINSFDIQIIFISVFYNDNRYSQNISLEEKLILKKTEINKIINKTLYTKIHTFYMTIYDIYVAKQKIYQMILNGSYIERYQFAWVEELGHAIIDKIEVKIGNQIIDNHTGDWLIIYNKLFINEHQRENYYKMIGNVDQLTIFDDSVKNRYKLMIPFQFWFCRHTGLSLPLIALRYHDITFNVKLKDLSKLCYVENDVNLLDMPNIQAQYNINIVHAKLYIDYIFLDSDERRRFAQSSHEYLIECIQYDDSDNDYAEQYKMHLNFSHSTKFIIWFAQPKYYRNNQDGKNKCQWNNFGTNLDKSGYTMKSTYLRLNSCDLVSKHLDIKYYNYIQPYLYFMHAPTDGLNIYSFSTMPMLHQPSGSINLSRIDNLNITSIFTDEFIKLINNGFHMAVYTMSYNILRIMSGMGGVAFQYISKM